jgi:hypothetical protein
MPKRPSFQFYPSDWLRDTALRSCSTGARGLWIDMICFMHEGNPYGHLKVGDKVILPVNLARMVGETLEVVEGWLKELHHAGVYDIADDGAICSRRMIRDENLRQIRALGGKLGGNPALINGDKVNLKVIQEVKQNPTPSSSSSSSSSKEQYNEHFLKFWNVYPNKKAKEAGWKAFKKLKADETFVSMLINAVREQGLLSKDVQYVPHASTWLNGKRWEDEIVSSTSSPKDWWMNDRRLVK